MISICTRRSLDPSSPPDRRPQVWCTQRKLRTPHQLPSASPGRQVPAAVDWEPADRASEARSGRAQVDHQAPVEAAERHWLLPPRTPTRSIQGRHIPLRHRADYFFERASHFLSGSCANLNIGCTTMTFVLLRNISSTTTSRNTRYALPVRELVVRSESASAQHVSEHIRFLGRDGRPLTLTPYRSPSPHHIDNKELFMTSATTRARRLAASAGIFGLLTVGAVGFGSATASAFPGPPGPPGPGPGPGLCIPLLPCAGPPPLPMPGGPGPAPAPFGLPIPFL